MWPRLKPTLAGTDNLVLSADLDRLARAELYDDLHRQHLVVGEALVAGIFASLAQDSFAMLPDTIREAGRAAMPAGALTTNARIMRAATTCRTAYDAWAIAVDVECAATDQLVGFLSGADDVRVKRLLLGRVRESAARTASYRMQRRAAFHAEKISEARIPFPDVRRIQIVSDLAFVAQAIERWMLRLLLQRNDHAEANDAVVELTRATIGRLEAFSGGHARPRRLTKWLDRLEASTGADDAHDSSLRLWQLKLMAEAGRVFDYYDRIFAVAELEEILLEAQALSKDALTRLRLLGDLTSRAWTT